MITGQSLAVDGGTLSGWGEDLRPVVRKRMADAKAGHGATPTTRRAPGTPRSQQLREWDPAWAEACVKMTTNPWRRGILPRKLVELIGVMLNAQCTSLNPEGTRRHIRAALDAGASREEILFVLKCAALGAIHSCSLGAPLLLEEAQAAGAALPRQRGPRSRRRSATG